MKRHEVLQAKAKEVFNRMMEQIASLPKADENYNDFIENQTFRVENQDIYLAYTMKDNELTISQFTYQNIPFSAAVRHLVDNWEVIISFVQDCLRCSAISLDEDMIAFQKFLEK